ncbi:MAG: secretion system protein E [Actinobacteria bacterium HGW-Actinobacteria-4]|nr:MAG: secretion system protein E [Actinobacteria bacterium HGW-Actinobacteria-4]
MDTLDAHLVLDDNTRLDDATRLDDGAALWGPLAPLLRTPGLTDIVVNGPGEVWLDRGLGLERADAGFGSAAQVRELAVRLASVGGRRLDDASPLVDARLPGGMRLHAALPPVADGCAILSLRTVRTGALTLGDLVNGGMLAPALVGLLEGLVAARVSVLISGATGAGKTTLMASLLSVVAASERIVVIEDAGEVMPSHPHVVRLVERPANVDGAGEVGLARLVREALRMRPDRVVLGECRGVEIREVLAAFNTGHRGGMMTVHANSAGDVPARLGALGALAGMSARAVDLFAAAAFEVVVHVERGAHGRRIAELGVLDVRGGELRVIPAVVVDDAGRVEHHAAWERLQSLAWGEVPRVGATLSVA